MDNTYNKHQWSIMFGRGEQWVVRGDTFEEVHKGREEALLALDAEEALKPQPPVQAPLLPKTYPAKSSSAGNKTRTEVPCVVCGMPALKTSGTNSRGEWWVENCKANKAHSRKSWDM